MIEDMHMDETKIGGSKINNLAILDGHSVKRVSSVEEWAHWFEANKEARRVAILDKPGFSISTVFLGIDYGSEGRPLWFETMIFGGPHGGFQERYETWTEAEEGHRRAVKLTEERTGV